MANNFDVCFLAVKGCARILVNSLHVPDSSLLALRLHLRYI
jgi:hypothetical protein